VLDYEEACSNISSFATGKRYVLKLHGCIRKRPDKIILTSSDYYRLMHDERYIRLLAWLISQHTILTIGFSLRDRDFRSFIEERNHLYGMQCPPIYAIVGENETCQLEMTALHNNYNIQLVPVSEADDFSGLTSLLFSLYCLIYRVDSSTVDADIENLVKHRVMSSERFQVPHPNPISPSAERARQLLSVFREPIDIGVFTTICMDAGLDLSPAHYRILGCATADNRIGLKVHSTPLGADRSFVAKWLASALEAIPMSDAPRYLSTYHKSFFDRYVETLRDLLSSAEGWEELIGEDDKAPLRLTRINEYFRQEGRWGQWLEIAEKAQNFVDQSSPLFIPLMRTKLWVYFWTRRYEEAKQLASKYPEVDEKHGESSYTERLMYMNPDNLPQLIDKLTATQNRDYFNESLLGRAYARLSVRESDTERMKALLSNAKEHLTAALNSAKMSNDRIETSVQSWYLACVLADLGEIDEAKLHLGETRRLDECIMNRVPGIAWLRMAEYRLAINDPVASPSTRKSHKEVAMSAMRQLGMIDVEQYVDKEYYY
jgi:tetratricopeptide (TPR) repeat protein